ncbi:ISNCY family transposase [Rubellimicrobium roseum]|uniref:ISNCY family transposase n=1 Tax=Rubellimicrobium roseum TaxID=687525 RepID=A0A5C4N309_9RHOB|nr:ISNCY family transposase [Rubellimicrobium roseum]TNC58980.1 ISNCY family transposase [Rubellimicrobium roseum]
MGWVLMSERELRRIEVLSRVVEGRLSVAHAAEVLGLSPRQVQRLLRVFREDGAPALRHKARGRPSNHRLRAGVRDLALALVRESYADFGPTLAAEKLAERHGLEVSRETLRKWMAEDGLWLSRTQRRQFHQPRLRRERLGELVQIDGSEHRWFEDRAPPCTLLVFIDDATSRLMQMRFVPSESTFSYFEALEGYLHEHGRPVAFYSDKHSIFRVAKEDARSGHGMTQFGRALAELNIEILCANSSQAKGRVERANRTLQDRLVKEMRLEGIRDMEDGNAFLPGFLARHNGRFARVPARSDDLHRPLDLPPERLWDILCWRDQRYVGQQLTLTYERKRIMLEATEVTRGLVGRHVDTYAFPDGRLDVRWRGLSLPYRVFDPDQQRVTHAAITENKRLSAVLEAIKEMQEAQPPKIPAAGKQRTRYQPTGQRSPGPRSFLDKRAARKADKTARGTGPVSDP